MVVGMAVQYVQSCAITGLGQLLKRKRSGIVVLKYRTKRRKLSKSFPTAKARPDRVSRAQLRTQRPTLGS